MVRLLRLAAKMTAAPAKRECTVQCMAWFAVDRRVQLGSFVRKGRTHQCRIARLAIFALRALQRQCHAQRAAIVHVQGACRSVNLAHLAKYVVLAPSLRTHALRVLCARAIRRQRRRCRARRGRSGSLLPCNPLQSVVYVYQDTTALKKVQRPRMASWLRDSSAQAAQQAVPPRKHLDVDCALQVISAQKGRQTLLHAPLVDFHRREV